MCTLLYDILCVCYRVEQQQTAVTEGNTSNVHSNEFNSILVLHFTGVMFRTLVN